MKENERVEHANRQIRASEKKQDEENKDEREFWQDPIQLPVAKLVSRTLVHKTTASHSVILSNEEQLSSRQGTVVVTAMIK